MSQLEKERVLICMTMRSEDTRGEALERRNRLLRDERVQRDLSCHVSTRPTFAVARRCVRRRGEPRAAQGTASLLGRESAARDAARAHAARRRRRPLRARALGLAVRACARPPVGAGWADGSTPRACQRRGPRRSSTPPPSSAASSTSISPSRRAPAPRTKCSTRSTRASSTQFIERDRLRGQRILVYSWAARRRSPPVDQSAPPRAHPRTRRGRDGGAQPRTTRRDRHALRTRRPAAQGVPHAIAAGAPALAMYAHAEARRFFEIAERAAPTPASARPRSSGWPRWRRRRAATR